MQENRVTVDGVSYPIELPFLVMATQNPIEIRGDLQPARGPARPISLQAGGRNPTAGEETDILRLHTRGFGLDRGVADQLAVVTSPAEVREMQQRAESVLVEDHLLAYIASLVRKTREWPTLSLGASPRAGVAIFGGRGPSLPWRVALTFCLTTFKTWFCRPCGIGSPSRPKPKSRASRPTPCSPSSSGPSRFPCDENDLAGSSPGCGPDVPALSYRRSL